MSENGCHHGTHTHGPFAPTHTLHTHSRSVPIEERDLTFNDTVIGRNRWFTTLSFSPSYNQHTNTSPYAHTHTGTELEIGTEHMSKFDSSFWFSCKIEPVWWMNWTYPNNETKRVLDNVTRRPDGIGIVGKNKDNPRTASSATAVVLHGWREMMVIRDFHRRQKQEENRSVWHEHWHFCWPTVAGFGNAGVYVFVVARVCESTCRSRHQTSKRRRKEETERERENGRKPWRPHTHRVCKNLSVTSCFLPAKPNGRNSRRYHSHYHLFVLGPSFCWFFFYFHPTRADRDRMDVTSSCCSWSFPIESLVSTCSSRIAILDPFRGRRTI